MIAEGEQDNADLWRKIRHVDEQIAHLVSARIVQFAREQQASILVFEHLGKLRPAKGTYSRRGNAKRAFWMKGRIFRYSQYKAWNAGGIITCRVNPRNTSRECHRCHATVIRYNQGQPVEGYTPGAALVYCQQCQMRGHADRNASLRIGQRLLARSQDPQNAHENHTTGLPYGPGEAGYVAQLKSYDKAFGLFFARLAKDGINKSNTLFVFTADEGDHFVGGPASPAGCDGVNIPCTYSQIGEIDANMTGLLATQQGITTPFDIHFDSAPVVYITGNPARTDTMTRAFERATGQLTAKNIYTGNTDQLTQFMADPVELQLLHMITADPTRTPTFT